MCLVGEPPVRAFRSYVKIKRSVTFVTNGSSKGEVPLKDLVAPKSDQGAAGEVPQCRFMFQHALDFVLRPLQRVTDEQY